MVGMEAWEWALLGGVAFVAISVLAQLMSWRRDALLAQLKRDMELERTKKRRAEETKKLQEKRKAAAQQPPAKAPAKKTA